MAAHTHHPDSSHAHHGNAARTYTLILVALLILTVITVAASRFDFGAANTVIALAIATFKGSLVALYFMHLRHEKPINGIIFLSSLAFLAIFLFGCLEDASTRWRIEPGNLKPGTAPQGQPQPGAAPGATVPGTPPGAPTAPATAAPGATGATGAPAGQPATPAPKPAH